MNGDVYATAQSPVMRFTLRVPAMPVNEDRFKLSDQQGPIGFSLWHAPGVRNRRTIFLIHGADSETRDMGFLIAYFVAHGLNVVSFDQRGTGQSAGNWQATGPKQKADDVIAMLRFLEHNPLVDAHRLGVWGPSNGGWVAPIVAARFPLAFVILKSPAAESIESNVLYEIEQALREHGEFTQAQIAGALQFERTMFSSLRTNSNWDKAAQILAHAQTQPWYPLMRIPPGFTAPPPAPMLSALQAALQYDPAQTLQALRVPTLILFGALDKNIDVADSATLYRTYFERSGLHDYAMHTFAGADHLLEDSSTGYVDEEPTPDRFVQGYPEIMISWLQTHDL